MAGIRRMTSPTRPPAIRVSGVFLYPVKSLRGCAVASAAVDELGFVGDRRFLVVDEAGKFMTQRVLPEMATVSTACDGDMLTLSTPAAGSVQVPTRAAGPAPLRPVTIWKSEGLLAEDCGDAVAHWLATVLRTPARLVRIGDAFRRPMLKPAARPDDRVAFADAFPFMVVSEGSLADLNARLAERGEAAVPMNRFRPSFILSGAAPYAEDTWPRVRVGEVLLRAGGPCGRCIVTTTDQQTGARGREPLALLASYRRDPGDPARINFGQNFIHETKSGTIRVGDGVQPL